MTLLDVKDLNVAFRTVDGVVRAVNGLSFTIERGQTLAIVGESGSGKSVSAYTLIGLNEGADVSGAALFEGRDLLAMDEDSLRAVRGAEIGMIFQDPLSSLHPMYRVGWQITETIRAHEPGVSKKEARNRAVDLLRIVGIGEPARRIDEFPHQYSGGMRQRALIAMAMALRPKLLIADEPTTALDVAVQAQVLQVIARLQEEFGTSILIITHDLRVVAEVADKVVVMYAGRGMETAARRELFREPRHPYTNGLLASLPDAHTGQRRLTPIPGQPPSLISLPPGCAFHPRCPYAFDTCATEAPPLVAVAGRPDHEAACWLELDLEDRLESAQGHRRMAAP